MRLEILFEPEVKFFKYDNTSYKIFADIEGSIILHLKYSQGTRIIKYCEQ